PIRSPRPKAASVWPASRVPRGECPRADVPPSRAPSQTCHSTPGYDCAEPSTDRRKESMESSTTTSLSGSAVDAPTLTEALRRTAANHPEIVAVRTPDDSVSLTWSQLLDRVDALAGGLVKLGVRRR